MPRSTILRDLHSKGAVPSPGQRFLTDCRGNPVYVDSNNERVLLLSIAHYTLFDQVMMFLTFPVSLYRGARFGVDSVDRGSAWTTTDVCVWIPRGERNKEFKLKEVPIEGYDEREDKPIEESSHH